MSDRIIDRNTFYRKVDKLLLNKPDKYIEIIQKKVNKHLEYAEKIDELSYNIDIVIAYMVTLDSEYWEY